MFKYPESPVVEASVICTFKKSLASMVAAAKAVVDAVVSAQSIEAESVFVPAVFGVDWSRQSIWIVVL